ncbi:MAG: glycoside hydrolase family protein [Patescibacteria group bacterium]
MSSAKNFYQKRGFLVTLLLFIFATNFLVFLPNANASLMEMVNPKKYIEGINNIPSTTPVSGNSSAETAIPSAPVMFTPNITIGSNFVAKTGYPASDGSLLGKYIQAWYTLIISVVGIIATVMLMWGGLKWLTSRGNAGAISDAKEIIWSAIIGLALTLLSWTVLSLINPQLLTMKDINLPNIVYKGSTDPLLGSSANRFSGEAGTGHNQSGATPGPTGASAAKVPCTMNDQGQRDYFGAYTASYEGYNPNRYWDNDGWTIGYGHHYPAGTDAPVSISDSEAATMYRTDYGQAFAAAQSTFSNQWDSMSSAQRASLADMAYNMGTGVFDKFPNMTANVRAGNFEGAAAEMLDSDYASQLPQRAANNASMLTGNNDSLLISQATPACE